MGEVARQARLHQQEHQAAPSGDQSEPHPIRAKALPDQDSIKTNHGVNGCENQAAEQNQPEVVVQSTLVNPKCGRQTEGHERQGREPFRGRELEDEQQRHQRHPSQVTQRLEAQGCIDHQAAGEAQAQGHWQCDANFTNHLKPRDFWVSPKAYNCPNPASSQACKKRSRGYSKLPKNGSSTLMYSLPTACTNT